MKNAIAILALLMAASAAQAAQYSIPKDTLVCVSEEGYDEQLQYAVQGVNELVDGCGFINADFPVVVLQRKILSASKVKIISNGLVVYLAGEHIRSN